MAVYSIEPIRSEWESRAPYEGDAWDRGDTDGQLDGWQVIRLRDQKVSDNVTAATVYPGMSTNGIIQTDKSEVFIVYADYDTGDTFGRDGNKIQILDIFEGFEQAIELRQVAQLADGHSLEFGDKRYYIGWNGYFERLNSVNVDRVSLHNYIMV